MHQQVSSIIGHLTKSHHEMARIIEAKRHVAVHMSKIIDGIPDFPAFNSAELITKNSTEVIKSVTNYLNSISELEEALAENLTYVMKELGDNSNDE